MPDLTLSFVNPRLFDDVSFHPCVRFKRWEVRTFQFGLNKHPNVICIQINNSHFLIHESSLKESCLLYRLMATFD